MTAEELNNRRLALSAKVMSLAAGTLMLNMRYMSKAISRLPARPGKDSYSCDGWSIGYDPAYLLERYKQSEKLPVHDCLHMLLHCIFRHWHTGSGIDRLRWNAACDIAVEAAVMKIGAGFCANERREQSEQLDDMWRELAKEIKTGLEDFGRSAGDDSNYLVQLLEKLHRERYDYAEFLRRFAVSGEIMRADLDSFEPAFYSYGMQLYGNVALIEPPEYDEIISAAVHMTALQRSFSARKTLTHTVKKTFVGILHYFRAHTPKPSSRENSWVFCSV